MKRNALVESAGYKVVIDLLPSQIRAGTAQGGADERVTEFGSRKLTVFPIAF